MTAPDLSIVVAAQGTPDETARCLRSLCEQQGISLDRLEIIVAQATPASPEQRVAAVAPITFLEVKAGSSLPLLHGAGMAASTAPLVAITEGHCIFADNWAATAIDAHKRSQSSVIGGAVLPGKELGTLNTALFLCDYAQFLPPLEKGSTADLPGNNVVFKRACLKDVSQFASNGFWKTFYCRQLEEQGHALEIDPAMVVYYNRRLTTGAVISRRYHHGRCFGGMRAGMCSTSKRAIYCAAGIALPALLSWKLGKRCLHKQQYLPQLLAVSPSAFLCLSTWAIGEWIGNLIGPGCSCDLL
jgi:hypothetical protein